MLALLLGTGLFLAIGLRCMPILKIPAAFRLMMQGRKSTADGDISPCGALSVRVISPVWPLRSRWVVSNASPSSQVGCCPLWHWGMRARH
jgi:hypothetical protein